MSVSTGTPTRIAKSSAIVVSIPEVNAMELEPISPELVLVDPELARVARARLVERDRPSAATGFETSERPVEPPPRVREPTEEAPPAPRVVSPSPSPRPRRRSASVLLTISLIGNAILVAVLVGGARDDRGALTLPAALRATTTSDVPPVMPDPSSKTDRGALLGNKRAVAPRRPAPKSSPKVVRETSGEVERKILNLVIQSPRGKLPPALIDSKTGLAKNGLQAVCRLSSAQRSFLCLVRPAHHRPTEGLYVRYRPGGRGGRGVFTWARYRSG
jgi:hypothetical protein